MKISNLVLSLGAAGVLTFAAAAAPAASRGADGLTKGSAAAPQGGKTFTHQAGGITFELPEGWESETEGDQLTVSAPDGSISAVFWVTEEDDFEEAAKALGEELAKQVKGLKFDGEPKEDTHNGMPHASVSGSGQIEGKDILFSADLLEAKKPVIVLTFGAAESLQKHAADYVKLVKSIKKIG